MNSIDFVDLDPIFKATDGQRMLENAFYSSYLLKGSIDYCLTLDMCIISSWIRTE